MIITDATHLPRLMNCNGSRLLDAPRLLIGGDDTIRDEGNAFHWLAQQIYGGADINVGRQAYNGVFITADMIEHAKNYISTLLPGEMEIITSFGDDENFQINSRADHIGYMNSVLEVTDAKYGYGVVEPDQNWTLIAHAVGWCVNSNTVPDTVMFTIYQPRAYHPLGSRRSWKISYIQLRELYEQIRTTLSNPSDTLQSGLHCYKCPLMSVCPAYRMASMNAIDATSEAFSDRLTPDELSAELDLIERAFNVISNRKKAIEELALYRVTNGEILQNRMIDRPKGQTRYRKGISAETLQAIIGKDISERKLPSIGKLRDSGIAQTVIDAITERPDGSARLVKVDVNKLAQKKLNVGVN